MTISWREIVGLLIGLAICYGLISYAVTNAPLRQEVASGQITEARQQTTSTTSAGNTKKVTLRITSPTTGEPFAANYGTLDSSRSVEGVTPKDYEIQVRIDPRDDDSLSATVWKTTGDSKELDVQVIDNGVVAKTNSTKEAYGAAYIRWSPNEQPSSSVTTPTTQPSVTTPTTQPSVTTPSAQPGATPPNVQPGATPPGVQPGATPPGAQPGVSPQPWRG